VLKLELENLGGLWVVSANEGQVCAGFAGPSPRATQRQISRDTRIWAGLPGRRHHPRAAQLQAARDIGRKTQEARPEFHGVLRVLKFFPFFVNSDGCFTPLVQQDAMGAACKTQDPRENDDDEKGWNAGGEGLVQDGGGS